MSADLTPTQAVRHRLETLPLARFATALEHEAHAGDEARFAAGMVGHVARRLLLGERLRPFVGQVDLDTLLGTMGD